MPSAPPPTSAPPSSASESSARESAVILLTTIGTLMVAVDSTIVILALPTMARELNANLTSVVWAILIYLLITAAFTTQAGRLGDMLGRAPIYNLGFAIFTVGSLFAGLSPNVTILNVSRAVQAIGGSLIFANSGALIAAAFPPARRGRAFGFLVFGWSVGAILGVLLGGAITTLIGWRYIFFINIPIGVVAIALGVKSLPRTPRVPTTFDWPGFALFSAMLTLICYGAIEVAVYGNGLTNYAYLVVGLLLIPLFVFLELRVRDPMLDLRQLNDRLLSFGLLAGFLQAAGYLAVIFLLTMYLQGLRGLTPLDASLLLVPGYLIGALTGPFFGRRIERYGARNLATAGIVLMAGAVLVYASMSLTVWLGLIPIVSLVTGIGSGMFYPANNTAIMGRARSETFGSISGLRATLTNMGTLISFVLAISIASASIPRAVAYEVFLGVGGSIGAYAGPFLSGLHAALIGSAVVLALAALLSWSRGREQAVGASRPAGAPPLAPGEP
jgi:EmrB/QacA subfamily drug resistance transporter